MKFTLFTTLALLGFAAAHPAAELEKRQVQTANLVFHGGPAEYSLAVPADGSVIPTNNNIAVSIIDSNDYNAIVNCKFTFAGGAQPTLVNNIEGNPGVQRIIVGPPTPVVSVSCQGVCIPVYGKCLDNNGQFTGLCCNGFCAGTLCRPWYIPQ